MHTAMVETLETRMLLSAGGLDASFNGTGKKLVALGAGAQINAVAVDASNQLTYVAGTSGGNMAVWRFKANGTLDTNFGTAGKATIDYGGMDVATAVAVQANGDIVVAGYTNFQATLNDFAVTRLTPGGDIDSTFGLDRTDFGFDDRATCLAFLSDGSIVVGGYDDGGKADFAVACFANSTYYPVRYLDPDFADGELLWKKSFTFGAGLNGGVEKANALAIGAGDKIVLAGYTDAGGTGNNFALARLNADGSFDKTFNSTGKRIVDFGFNDQASSVAIQSDGKIVAAGFDDGGQADFAAVRLNSNGSLDTAFNHKAVATTANGNGKISFTFGAGTFGGVEKATGVAVITGGKILLGGYTDAGGITPNNFALARLTPAGVLDTTFGTGGKVITNLGADDHAFGLAALPDGRAILAGTSKATRATSLALAEYLGDSTRLGSIAGSVFDDHNGNGVKGTPDAPLSVPVFLDLNHNGVWEGDEPGTSQLSSDFDFTSLPPATFLVRPMPAFPRYRITTAATVTVNLVAGANVKGILFGFTQLARLSGVVFTDKNGNAKQDTGEQGLGGWTVFLDMNNDGKLDTGDISTVTSSTGAYSFNVKADPNAPAIYRIWIVQKSGFKRIAPSAEYHIDAGAFAEIFTGLNFAEKPTTLPG